ncbi:hypothetical protein AAK938_05845 [Aerococcaceae bacterium 50-4]
MTQEKLNQLFSLYQEASVEDILNRLDAPSTQAEMIFYKALLNLKLAERQENMLNEDGFVI